MEVILNQNRFISQVQVKKGNCQTEEKNDGVCSLSNVKFVFKFPGTLWFKIVGKNSVWTDL